MMMVKSILTNSFVCKGKHLNNCVFITDVNTIEILQIFTRIISSDIAKYS